jgi:hypothetical protein
MALPFKKKSNKIQEKQHPCQTKTEPYLAPAKLLQHPPPHPSAAGIICARAAVDFGELIN